MEVGAGADDGTGAEAGIVVGAGAGAGAGAAIGAGTGIGVVLCIAVGAWACCAAAAAFIWVAVGMTGTGTGVTVTGLDMEDLLSFLGVALLIFPAAPAMVAGRGEFLGVFVFANAFGLGAGATSGDTVKSSPMLGNGATGLFSCFKGLLAFWRAGETIVIFGDSRSMVMGAGGAIGFDSG